MPLPTLRFASTLALTGSLAACSAQRHASPHLNQSHQAPLAHHASPEHYTLLHEDDRIRVIDFVIEPGFRDQWHRHPHEAFYILKGGTLPIEPQDGDPIELTIKPGDVVSHEAWTHRVSNIGNTTVHAMIFETKDD
ncbi:MAG: cupin domain-containing protein [Phycisphaerales bacterium]